METQALSAMVGGHGLEVGGGACAAARTFTHSARSISSFSNGGISGSSSPLPSSRSAVYLASYSRRHSDTGTCLRNSSSFDSLPSIPSGNYLGLRAAPPLKTGAGAQRCAAGTDIDAGARASRFVAGFGAKVAVCELPSALTSRDSKGGAVGGIRWNGSGFAGQQLRLPRQQHRAIHRKRCGAIAAVASPVSEKQMSMVGGSAKIGVLGASGYTGAEIVRLLAGHPYFQIALMTADRKAGLPFQNVFPHLGAQDLPDLIAVKDADFDHVDAVFCCLPHGTTQEIIASLPKQVKVVDLSADFRLRDTEEYKQWYHAEHKAPELQKEAVYGLTELYRDEIKTARLVANPGCYPTTVQLALSPLLRDGLISSEGIVIDAKSGVSGAGRSAKESNLYSEVAEGIYAYGITNHRHVPEIEQGLADFAGKRMRVSFTPHLLPVIRGMQSTMYVEMAAGKTVDDLRDRLQLQFQDEEFVTVMPKGGVPHTHYVRGSNYCLIGLFEDRIPGRAIIISVIDNLVKGASGQALQNMNLIMGVPENSGLQQQPLFP